MILPFSTQLNGKPTYFVEKIWKGLSPDFILNKTGLPTEVYPKEYIECLQKELVNYENKLPKLHTIREDAKDRWKTGTMIDFFINCRQPTMFRFAPKIPVVSVQEVEIIVNKFEFMNDYEVKIDGKLLSTDEKVKLAIHDGFDNLLQFFIYFNKDFKGKLIHWTNLKY